MPSTRTMTVPGGMFCLLFLVGAAAGSTYGGGGSGVTIETVRGLVEGLEGELYDINKDLSIIKTFAASADDRFNLIDDRLIPYIRIINEQQDDLIAKAEDQVSALQDRVDAALAGGAGAKEFAREIGIELRKQTEFMADTFIRENKNQAEQIFFLRKTIKGFEDELLQRLYEYINSLTRLHDEAYGKIIGLENFVDSRIVEYGIASVDPGETFIPFTIDFPDAPDVNVFFTGFTARLDNGGGYGGDSGGYGEAGFTRLALDKHPSGVTREGFTINANDLSKGSAAADMFFCTYMASYNLDRDVDLDFDDGKNGGFNGKNGGGRGGYGGSEARG